MEATLMKGYKQVTLPELQAELKERCKELSKTYMELAREMDVKSITTIQNILNSEIQVVSDGMFTNFINLLGLNAFVKWQDGERNYYIKN